VKSISVVIASIMLTASIASGQVNSPREYSFDLWDWTPPCRDLGTFKLWAADLKSIGVNRIEISVPWNVLEPKSFEYDLSFIADRLAVAKSLGMGLRIRINSYYAGATPAWLVADRWRDAAGAEQPPVSINDERFWAHYAPLCTHIAGQFKGEDIYYNAFIGIHAELKWADWWTFDESSLALWRKTIADRPQWLRDVVGDAELPQTPAVPGPTHATPDTSPASLAFIAFREHCWRDAMRRFNDAIHQGNPSARTSAPLGESFRRGSAQMSNLDYFGLTRGAQQVVHSYDFSWHAKDDPWYAAAAVASFEGITQLPVSFEFDGPNPRYTDARLLEIADAVLAQGAGLKVSNYCYGPQLPSSYPLLRELGKRVAAAPEIQPAAPSQTILLFVSKWANLCYREKTEWLHDAQFGAWEMLRDRGLPVRFICEDNLDEDLSHYRGLYVAFSPPPLIPTPDRDRLARLCDHLPTIVELSEIPPAPPRPDAAAPAPVTHDRCRVLNFALGYAWLHEAQRPVATAMLSDAMSQTWDRK
jgi:hypothetical protein